MLALKVEDVGEKLRVRRKNVDGELLTYTKNRRKRSVPFTAAVVRQDVAEYVKRDPSWAAVSARRWRSVARARLPQLAQARLSADRQDGRAAGAATLRPTRLIRVAAGRGRLHAARGRSPRRPQRDTCERYYAKIFDDVDPANRVGPEHAIRVARQPGQSGVARLFDLADGAGS